MNQQKPGSNINDLIAAAHGEAVDQADKTAAAAARLPKTSRAKPLLALVLLLAFIAIAAAQFPKFEEPFGSPPALNVEVAKTDLRTIATVIESHRAAKGQYPATLQEIDLPDTMDEYVKERPVSYRLSGNTYVLELNMPEGRVVYDGDTGEAKAQ